MAFVGSSNGFVSRRGAPLVAMVGCALALAGCAGGDAASSATSSTVTVTVAPSAPLTYNPSSAASQPKSTSGAVTVADVRGSAQVPAYCRMPAQTLTNGVTSDKYKPREGWLKVDDPAPVLADLDSDGSQELVARYLCTAGGVAWPEVLVIYGPGGTLKGSLELGEYGQQEHAEVLSWQASGQAVELRWRSYEGAASDFHYYRSRLTMSGGKARLTDTRAISGDDSGSDSSVSASSSDTSSTEPAPSSESSRTPTETASVSTSASTEKMTAVCREFLQAAVAGNTARMKRLAPASAVTEVTNYGPYSSAGRCSVDPGAEPSAEVVLGPRQEGAYGIIFKLTFEVDSAGDARIRSATFAGDAG